MSDPLDLRAALDELERMISTQVVAAEPITCGDHVVTPLCSVGFGFGAARGSGDGVARAGDRTGAGSGAGVGFGGGVRPVAVVISGPDGVRVEPLAADKGVDLAALAKAVRGDADADP